MSFGCRHSYAHPQQEMYSVVGTPANTQSRVFAIKKGSKVAIWLSQLATLKEKKAFSFGDLAEYQQVCYLCK